MRLLLKAIFALTKVVDEILRLPDASGLAFTYTCSNTMTISVFERRREIGVLRSMGGTGWRIARVFWIEGMSLASVAWLAAVILGIPAAYAFVRFIGALPGLPQILFTFNPMALVVMLIFIIVIATLASFGPVLKASQVRIADTLRYE